MGDVDSHLTWNWHDSPPLYGPHKKYLCIDIKAFALFNPSSLKMLVSNIRSTCASKWFPFIFCGPSYVFCRPYVHRQFLLETALLIVTADLKTK